MRWAGPGNAPATPDAATLEQLAAQPGMWSPWSEGVRRALQRTHLELARRNAGGAAEQVVKSWAVVAHTSTGRQASTQAVSQGAAALQRCS